MKYSIYNQETVFDFGTFLYYLGFKNIFDFEIIQIILFVIQNLLIKKPSYYHTGAQRNRQTQI